MTLHEAMARALRYNIDRRVELQQQLLAMGQFDQARDALLPSLVAQAGLTRRDRDSWSSSRDRDQAEPGGASLSQDRTRGTADVTVAWNVLDFGVSYYSARQQADRTLVADERRRLVVTGIVQDVRSAYWRAVAAERMLAQIDPLAERVDTALAQARELETQRIGSLAEALTRQRMLLEIRQQLDMQRRELHRAQVELASLINLPPGIAFTVALPDADDETPPMLVLDIERLELIALANRPELREARYNARIARDETHKALARLLPGIELRAGVNVDTNSFLLNNQWADYGVQVTWNLLNTLRGPVAVRAAEAAEALADEQRLSLSMAVLTQLHVAHADYRDALERLEIAEALQAIGERLFDQALAERQADRLGELDSIRAELESLQSALTRDLVMADVQNAIGRLLIAVGADPLPTMPDAALSLDALAAVLRAREAEWLQGSLALADALVSADPVME